MPIQSRIARPSFDDNDLSLGLGHQETWSSPHSDHLPSDTFHGHQSGLGFSPDGASDFYAHGSRTPASFSGSIGNEGSLGTTRSISNPRSLSTRSHISISSASSPLTNARNPGLEAEVIYLRGENQSLKQEKQRLLGQVEALSESYARLVQGIGNKVDETRKDVNALIQSISVNFTGPVPGIEQKPDIPLNPRQDGFPKVRHWQKGPWNTLRKGASKNSEQDARTYSAFMEDEFGNPVPDTTRRSIRSDFYSYFTETYNKGRTPKGYKDTDLSERESHRIAMEGKYPWLRLCDASWKFQQVWTHSLSKWRATKQSKTAEKAPADDQPIIELSSEEDSRGPPKVILEPPTSDSSGGAKRRRDGNEDAGTSKKHKATEPSTPFHSAKPKPKGKQIMKFNQTDPFLQSSITPMPIKTSVPIPTGVRDAPVASGSGTVHSSPPPPPQVTMPPPKARDNAPEAISTVPFTNITMVPDTLPVSPSPEPPQIPSGVHSSQIVPETPARRSDSAALDTPQIPAGVHSSQIVPETPAHQSDNAASDKPGRRTRGRNKASSGSSTGNSAPGVHPKKKKGPVAYKQFCLDAWKALEKNTGSDKERKTRWNNMSREARQIEYTKLTAASVQSPDNS